MSISSSLDASARAAAPVGGGAGAGRLALALQEVLTTITRLRAGRHAPTDAQRFRAEVTGLLEAAEQSALRAGYPVEYAHLALYAATALLDESVLNSRQPAFADWARRPLGNELFGGHVGGEEVFAQLRHLLAVPDSPALADLLEVYHLCLLLGFRGKYDLGNGGELHGLVAAVTEKVRRIRGAPRALSPDWRLPADERPPARRDAWARRITICAGAVTLIAATLYAGFRMTVRDDVAGLRAEAAPGAR